MDDHPHHNARRKNGQPRADAAASALDDTVENPSPMQPWAMYRFKTTKHLTYEVDPVSFELLIHMAVEPLGTIPGAISDQLVEWLRAQLPLHAVAGLMARSDALIISAIKREFLVEALTSADISHIHPD